MKASTDTKEISARVSQHFLNSSSYDLFLPYGSTLQEIVDGSGIDRSLHNQIRISINGDDIPSAYWAYIKPKQCACIQISLVPMGGDVLKTVALIAVSAAVPVVGPAVAGSIGVTGALGVSLVTAGVGLIGTMLVGALFPPPKPPRVGGSSQQESPTLSISGQSNQAYHYGPVRRVYGTHKMFPVVVGAPFTTTVGNTKYLYGLYDFGYGELDVEDIRIGETPIAQFDNVDYVVRSDTSFSIYTNDVNVSSVGSVYTENGDTNTRNTVAASNGFEIDFLFASGLVGFSKDGGKKSRSVDFRVEYRPVGTSTWMSATDGDYFTSGENVRPGDSSDITLTPKQYSYGFYFGDEGGDSYHYESIGFDCRSNNTFSYSGEDPDIGQFVVISGDKIRISSVDTGSKTITIESNGNHYPVGKCYRSYDSGLGQYVYTCDSSSGYATIATSGVPDGSVRITAKRQNPVNASFGIRGLAADQYEVRLTRLSVSGGGNYQNSDDATWESLKSYKDSSPVNETKTHTYLELKIQASEQLSGVIQNLSAICTSKLDVFNGTSWVNQATNNPAWIYADIITGESSPRPLSKDRLDTVSLLNWASFCDDVPISGQGKRCTANFVVDYNTTVSELLDQVCSIGYATKTQFNGKYGVAIDEEKSIPVQTFTPRNSFGFSSSRTYIDEPQALKVKFVDPDNNWQVRERVVYNDGFDVNNTTVFEEAEAFGITNPDQAYRFGRRMIAQGILRQEDVRITTYIENLRCTRGDLVTLVQDVMKIGGIPARIKSISGNDVEIDEIFAPGAGSYGYEVRGATGVRTGLITALVSDTVVTVDDTTDMLVGGMLVAGFVGQLSNDYLVKSIDPNPDQSAELTLVEYAPAIFTSDTEEIPAYDPQESNGIIGEIVAASGLSGAEVLAFNIDGTANKFIELSWDEDNRIINSDVYLSIDGNEALLIDTVEEFQFTYTVDEDDLNLSHVFYIDARNSYGNHAGYLASPSVSVTPVGDITPPGDVENLRLSVISETIQIDWDSLVDESLSYYQIRYSPFTDDSAIWASSQILIDEAPRNSTSVNVNSRVGTYMIKAFDGSGNQSDTEGRAVTTIPQLRNLNVITTRNDAPTWGGIKSNVEEFGGTLVLEEQGGGLFFSSGRYEYSSILDLGQIFTSRVTNKLVVTGYSIDDLMVNWNPLSEVEQLQTWQEGNFTAKSIIRTASILDTIDSWDPLSDVTSMVGGENWTEWKPFISGDYTGRYYQFGIDLFSNDGIVSPVISDGLIEIDMPDRISSDNDIISSISGDSIVYDPAFKEKPALQVTIDDAQTGDYYTISNHDRTGFDITFFDSTDTAVSRQYDWMAQGYGYETTEII